MVGEDPDCENCPSIIRRKINKDRDIIIHEDFNRRLGKNLPERYANDIALIRIDEAIPLHQEETTRSLVEPICLPWSKSVESAWDIKE